MFSNLPLSFVEAHVARMEKHPFSMLFFKGSAQHPLFCYIQKVTIGRHTTRILDTRKRPRSDVHKSFSRFRVFFEATSEPASTPLSHAIIKGFDRNPSPEGRLPGRTFNFFIRYTPRFFLFFLPLGHPCRIYSNI